VGGGGWVAGEPETALQARPTIMMNTAIQINGEKNLDFTSILL
jgi:hypothetical protein